MRQTKEEQIKKLEKENHQLRMEIIRLSGQIEISKIREKYRGGNHENSRMLGL